MSFHPRRFLSGIALMVALTLAAPLAQTRPDVLGFDSTMFDRQTSLASSAGDARAWLDLAEEGAMRSQAAWEGKAQALYEDEAERDEARTRLKDWLQGELDRRFGEWLFDRFYGEAARAMEAGIYGAARQADRD